MIREGHEEVQFFIGEEVEHTPAFGMRTLFVVGIQPTADIQAAAVAYKCNHIYFGANQSFPKLGTNDEEWFKWEDMIQTMLRSSNYCVLRSESSDNKPYMCTLDIDVSCVEGLLESPLVEYDNFIPMISVKIPYIKQFGYNATLKIDDKDFQATNPGVWCHSLHDLQNRSVFTDWSKYTKDTVIS
jgi:hypothetical protein